jgi:hypothetical protein
VAAASGHGVVSSVMRRKDQVVWSNLPKWKKDITGNLLISLSLHSALLSTYSTPSLFHFSLILI